MKWTNEDIEKVEKFIQIKNRGMYCDSKQLNEVYNRVLEKNATPTSCGSCMRHRISELETALKSFKKQAELSGLTVSQLVDEINGIKADLSLSEKVSEQEQTITKEEENKDLTEAEKMKEKMAKVRAARKAKK